MSKLKDPSQSSDNKKIVELLEKTNKLLERASSKENIVISNNTGVREYVEEKDIDSETLKEIHARKVGKITKNAEDNFTNDETKIIVDSSMAENISELENLL
jgi:hypothetical protein